MALGMTSGVAAAWLSACWIDDLPIGWGQSLWLDGRQVAIFRFPDGTVHATSPVCPSTGAPVMVAGIMGTRLTSEGLVHTLTGAGRKEGYRLDTGDCLASNRPRLPVYPVRVEEGRVLVGAAALQLPQA